MYCRRAPSGRGRPAVVRAGRSLPRRPPSSAGGRAMSYNMTYARKSGAGARTADSRRLRRWCWRRRRGRLGHAAGISNIIGHARPRLLGRPCGGRGCGALFGCGALPVVPFPPAAASSTYQFPAPAGKRPRLVSAVAARWRPALRPSSAARPSALGPRLSPLRGQVSALHTLPLVICDSC